MVHLTVWNTVQTADCAHRARYYLRFDFLSCDRGAYCFVTSRSVFVEMRRRFDVTSFERLENFNQITRHHIQEKKNLHFREDFCFVLLSART